MANTNEQKTKTFTINWVSTSSTGKSLSEPLLFAEHGENMLCTKIVLNVRNNFCTQHVLPRFELGIFMYWTCNSMNNLSSYCGLVDAKIRASDKDLPVHKSTMFVRYKSGIKFDWNRHGVPLLGDVILLLPRYTCKTETANRADTSHSAYVATETELYGAKIDGLLPPTFL